MPAGTHDLELVVSMANVQRGVLNGLVISDATGEPLSAFSLETATRLKGTLSAFGGKEYRTGEPGRFRFDGLLIGADYAIKVGAEDHAWVWVGPWTEQGEERDIVIRLPGTGTIDVVVTDSHGRGASRVTALAERLQTPFSVPNHGAQADEQGHAILRSVDPGRYRVSAFDPHAPSAAEHTASAPAEEVGVLDGRTVFVQLRLPD